MWMPQPPVQQRSAGTGTTVWRAIVLLLLLANLGLTFYVFRVAKGLVDFGTSVSSVFGG
jgi:hypothetical protein